MMSSPSRVDGCCCGQPHQADPGILAAFERVTAGLDPLFDISVPGEGTWRVPRLYVACHGLAPGDLPKLAATYGWERVPR